MWNHRDRPSNAMHPCKADVVRQDVSWKRLKQKSSTEGRKVARETTARIGKRNHCGLTKEWSHKQGKVLERSTAPQGKE